MPRTAFDVGLPETTYKHVANRLRTYTIVRNRLRVCIRFIPPGVVLIWI